MSTSPATRPDAGVDAGRPAAGRTETGGDASASRAARERAIPPPPPADDPFTSERAGVLWLGEREVLRVLKLWSQTIGAQVVSSLLFILVFGLALGDRVSGVDGVPFAEYIVPGLVVQAVVQAAYSNTSSTLFQSKMERYINDVLAAPMRWWEVNVGLAIGGVVRGLLIAVALTALAIPLTGVGIARPLVLVVAVLLALVLFAQVGVLAGIYAKSWDHSAFINNMVILPLSFLGGIFYSVSSLPPIWEAISHVNPIFYLVQAVRYGFLGVSDVPVLLALGVTAGMAVAASAWCGWVFRTGHRLKP